MEKSKNDIASDFKEYLRELLKYHGSLIDANERSNEEVLATFKKNYVDNELLVEKNDTPEQRQGLSLVYDFIQSYDVENKDFNLFINALEINSRLWKFVDDKFKTNLEDARKEVQEMKEFAFQYKDPITFKKAMVKERELAKISEQNKIGGRFRTSAEDARLKGVDVSIPFAREAVLFMNSFLTEEKKQELINYYNDEDIFNYIDYCIRITTEMMRNQPFVDGNKRTFRGLLNLLFKFRNIPPVYIAQNERDEYKDYLFDAMKTKDYSKLCNFYYFRIFDSLKYLDLLPYLNETDVKTMKG